MPRSWPPRPTVFGNMICASMPHSSRTSRRTFGSYEPTCVSSIDQWLSARSALSFWPSLPITAPALARPSGWPSNTHVGMSSTTSTCGTRSLYFSGASSVKRSCRSVKWESASMTRVPSLSMWPGYRWIGLRTISARGARIARMQPGDVRIGWIGTGVMGASMCGHLLAAGHPVTVTTRTRAKADALVGAGAAWADSPAAVAAANDVVFVMVGYPHEVEEVALGALSALAAGALLVDMTTSRPALAVEIAERAT